jgi:hypothetical protein
MWGRESYQSQLLAGLFLGARPLVDSPKEPPERLGALWAQARLPNAT